MGRLCASRLEEALTRSGVDVHALGTVLDFGCGCGRTLRHFKHLERTRLHGTDYNPVLVEWCLRNLHFAEFSLNGLEPPLAHAEAAFDLVYALSVFTHLPEPLQHSWMRELARVVKPGGYLALSTMPEETLPTPDARQRFLAGDLVVLNAGEAGTNDCTAYHPRAYMTDRLATAFDVVEYVPNGVGQHLWLLRKKPAGGGPAG
jgi:SAM-dependent methyltransferase